MNDYLKTLTLKVNIRNLERYIDLVWDRFDLLLSSKLRSEAPPAVKRRIRGYSIVKLSSRWLVESAVRNDWQESKVLHFM